MKIKGQMPRLNDATRLMVDHVGQQRCLITACNVAPFRKAGNAAINVSHYAFVTEVTWRHPAGGWQPIGFVAQAVTSWGSTHVVAIGSEGKFTCLQDGGFLDASEFCAFARENHGFFPETLHDARVTTEARLYWRGDEDPSSV